MAYRDLLSITPYPAVSIVIWLVVAIAGLYLARDTAHRVILTLFQALHDALKLGAQALNSGEGRLSARNREVLLAAGREAKERIDRARAPPHRRQRPQRPGRLSHAAAHA